MTEANHLQTTGSSANPTPSPQDAEGLWQQTRETPAEGTEGKSLPDTHTFKYEDGLVTLRLLVISKHHWKSDDGFYALKARWEGNTLYYLAPLGQWTELVEFEDGRFVAYGGGMKREYARIRGDEVVEYNRDILDPDRLPHDYQQTMK